MKPPWQVRPFPSSLSASNTTSTPPSVTLQGGTSFLTFPPDQKRRVETRTQPHQREHEGKKKIKPAPRLQWGLSELSSWVPNSDYVSGKQFALEWDISDNRVSVNWREEKFHLGLVKEPFVFTPRVRPVSTVWVLLLHLWQQTSPSCFPTPAVTFYLEKFRSLVHVNHIVHLKQCHVFDLASLINPITNPGTESKVNKRDAWKEFFHLVGQKKRNLCTSQSGIGCAGD